MLNTITSPFPQRVTPNQLPLPQTYSYPNTVAAIPRLEAPDSFRRVLFTGMLRKDNPIHIDLDHFTGKTYLAIHEFATVSSGVNPLLEQVGNILEARGDRLLIYTPDGLSDHHLSGIDPQLGKISKIPLSLYPDLPTAFPVRRPKLRRPLSARNPLDPVFRRIKPEAILTPTPQLPLGMATLLWGKNHHVPVTIFHSTNFPLLIKNHKIFRIFPESWINRIYTGMFERRMYGLSAKTVVHTPFAQEKLQQQGFKNQQGFEVAGMGVDVNVFSPKERLAPQDFFQTFANKIDKPVKHPDWKIITTVSRISPEKELDKLLNLAPKLAERQLNLVIAGDGPQLKALKAKYNHLDNVIFLGHVQHGPELAKVYASADIFVAPSTCDEGGCTSFESVACGTPAIVPGPNIQGPSQLLLPSENALFFSPASKPAQTEQAILDTIDDMLAQQNQGEFQRVSVSKTAQEHYSWESFTDHLLAGLVPIDSSVWNEKKR